MSHRIRPFVNYFQDDWSEWLPMVDFAASCLPHESTGVSPFFAECGYEPRLSIDWDQPEARKPGSTKGRINREEADQFVQRMQEIWDLAKGSMKQAQERQKKPPPPPPLILMLILMSATVSGSLPKSGVLLISWIHRWRPHNSSRGL
jgi:hypothetical protein